MMLLMKTQLVKLSQPRYLIHFQLKKWRTFFYISNCNGFHFSQESKSEKTEDAPEAAAAAAFPAAATPSQPPPTSDEDITNEAYAQRHDRALAEERKKFTTFLKFPYSTRSRANRRIDSQSSGANTPDPMSPAPGTPAAATNIDQEVSFLIFSFSYQ